MIASTLLGVDPPRLPALALVRSGELFGLSEGATRTALSRMAANGEVVADDGHYSLSGALLERHARQQAARTAPDREADWDGTWIAAVVTEDRRRASDRAAFRAAATRAHLAEIREGLWMRPDHRRRGGPDGHPVLDAQATWLREIRPDDPDALVREFALDSWADRTRSLLETMERWQPALDRREVGALGETFVVDADVLRHLVADPDLPTALLPSDWPGPSIREAFAAFDRAFKATWREWYQSFQTS
ncbi:MAG: hypothetical protein OSA99_07670 [Acidimicrobiales bacterium]|nr:hypothetical protein [Acidimicrobiales bacterium]